MEFCSGSDLSVYIKNRGKTPTLDFVPRPGMTGSSSEGGKVWWPHPEHGGIDERVTRCFLGQLGESSQTRNYPESSRLTQQPKPYDF